MGKAALIGSFLAQLPVEVTLIKVVTTIGKPGVAVASGHAQNARLCRRGGGGGQSSHAQCAPLVPSLRCWKHNDILELAGTKMQFVMVHLAQTLFAGQLFIQQAIGQVAVALLPVPRWRCCMVGVVKLGRWSGWITLFTTPAFVPPCRERWIERIAVVDVDEKKFIEIGRWPWPATNWLC